MTNEQVAGVVNHALDNLKNQPVIMAMLIFNAAFLGIIAWLQHERGAERHAETTSLLQDLRACQERDAELMKDLLRSPRGDRSNVP